MQHEHRALVKALSRGDGETAERISREQIEAARSMVLSAIMTSNTVMNLALTQRARLMLRTSPVHSRPIRRTR